jgi:hypothetical protein
MHEGGRHSVPQDDIPGLNASSPQTDVFIRYGRNKLTVAEEPERLLKACDSNVWCYEQLGRKSTSKEAPDCAQYMSVLLEHLLEYHSFVGHTLDLRVMEIWSPFARIRELFLH